MSKTKTHKKFIRSASAIVRSWNVDRFDRLPQNLSECSEETLAMQAFIYSEAIREVAVEEAKAFVEGRIEDMTRTPKIKKLLSCYKSGHMPNRI